jgi:hypothetical protein
MEKLIIFCKNAVETLTYFSMQLAEAFEAWGYETFWFDMQMAGLSAWKLRQAMEQKKEAVLLTFNFIGLSGEEELWELDDFSVPRISLWEKLDIFCLNIMVDHPVYYDKALAYRLPRIQTFCVDRDHVAYMKRFYPKTPCEFLPLAGNDLLPAQAVLPDTFEQWQRRPYPLVFTANYVPVANIDRQLMEMETEYREFYYEIIESFIKEPGQDLLSCIESYLRREMPDLTDAQVCEGMHTMPVVDLWIRTYFREKTVRILAEGGIKVHLFGKDWDLVACAHPENLVSAGRMVSSGDCVQAIAQANIALNTMPWFKDGAHDRIFTAMLHGAAALTDGSTYLREQFAHMDTVAFYDLQSLECLPQQVEELLGEPQRLYEMACRGKAVAKQLHRWKNRAEILKGYV